MYTITPSDHMSTTLAKKSNDDDVIMTNDDVRRRVDRDNDESEGTRREESEDLRL